MFKNYYQLAKPGIIYGNVITALAGFFLASRGVIDWGLLIAMLVGLALVMGGACVFNNYIDRDIDAKMDRTKLRASVTGAISKNNTLTYGSVLVLVGGFILWQFTTPTAFIAALVGVVFYVALYTPSKRRTVYSTLIGSIAGAVPPVVGYCAVTYVFNLEAFVLFLIFAFWQMPHFYAIAMYRLDEYAAAMIPILPIKRGMKVAKADILFYILLFLAAAALLTILGFTGYIYLAVILILGFIWLWYGLQGLRVSTDDKVWARKMFLFSLVVVTVLSITIGFGGTYLSS